MCGIVGMFSFAGGVLPIHALPQMNAALIHRGPDEEGSYADNVVGLAIRRLSIIGLDSGTQPIFNEDRDVCMVMNGEIYNYREIRAELEDRGHVFTTKSDVEVAVHLYEELDERFVQKLRGMFAYALYDRPRRTLYLGRDRLGKKPLYYAMQAGLLLFASEIKSLHASGLLGKELDQEALNAYLAHGFVIGGRTLFSGICKLPPASMLRATVNGIDIRRYWEIPLPTNPANIPGGTTVSFDNAAMEVRRLLEEAVRIRLMSEVPLGAFLSGGVDSSAIVAIMSREMAAPVETFTVGFDKAEFDELAFARSAAQLYGTHHHEVMVRDCTPEMLQEINFYHDEPAADPANVPTFCLAKFSRQYVTVALTGEGGDELFAGYRHYQLYRRFLDLKAMFPWVRNAAHLLDRLAPWLGALGPRRLWKGIWVMQLPPEEFPRGMISIFTDREIEKLVIPEFLVRADSYRRNEFLQLQDKIRDADGLAQSLYIDALSQLPEQLLMKVDKMTMAASLEARCPFLDQLLFEYVGALPTWMKISQAGSKLLLKRALKGLVPDELLERPKQGFEVPIRQWLLGSLYPLVNQLLLSPGARLHTYVRPDFIRTAWTRLKVRQDNHLARQLWLLLNLAVWYEQHWAGHQNYTCPQVALCQK